MSKDVAKQDEIRLLAKKGPQFPLTYHMSDFSVTMFVKGNWPMLIEYEADGTDSALCTVSVDGVEPFSWQLPATGRGEPRQLVLTLPENFGEKIQVGRISFKASNNQNSKSDVAGGSAYFRLYTLGMGEGAVAPKSPSNAPKPGAPKKKTSPALPNQPDEQMFFSAHAGASIAGFQTEGLIAIDPLTFQPESIDPRQGGLATYEFSSSSQFDSWAANLLRVTETPDHNDLIFRKIKTDTYNEVIQPGQSLNRDWDGKIKLLGMHKISRGEHKVQICVWEGLQNRPAALCRTSRQVVYVE